MKMRFGSKKIMNWLKQQLYSPDKQKITEALTIPATTVSDCPETIENEQMDKPVQQLSAIALHTIFRKNSCCQLDGLNEYDDDFTNFEHLGDVITHEMQGILEKATQQNAASIKQQSSEILAEHPVENNSKSERDLS
jgi:hypothetical protein